MGRPRPGRLKRVRQVGQSRPDLTGHLIGRPLLHAHALRIESQRHCAAQLRRPRAILRDSVAHNAQCDSRSGRVEAGVHLALKGATRIGHRLHADTGLDDADFASQVGKPRAPVSYLLVDTLLIDQSDTRRSDPHDDAHVAVTVVDEGKRAIIRINVLADTRSRKQSRNTSAPTRDNTDRPGPVHGTSSSTTPSKRHTLNHLVPHTHAMGVSDLHRSQNGQP